MIYFIVGSGNRVEENPVKRACNNADIELVVVEDRPLQVAEHAVVNVVFTENEETAPRDDGGNDIKGYV